MPNQTGTVFVQGKRRSTRIMVNPPPPPPPPQTDKTPTVSLQSPLNITPSPSTETTNTTDAANTTTPASNATTNMNTQLTETSPNGTVRKAGTTTPIHSLDTPSLDSSKEDIIKCLSTIVLHKRKSCVNSYQAISYYTHQNRKC